MVWATVSEHVSPAFPNTLYPFSFALPNDVVIVACTNNKCPIEETAFPQHHTVVRKLSFLQASVPPILTHLRRTTLATSVPQMKVCPIVQRRTVPDISLRVLSASIW